MNITHSFFKLFIPVLQQDVIQVLNQSQSVGQELARNALFWINILLGVGFAIGVVVIVTASDQGEAKNKKVGNWLYFLGFAAVGLLIIRKAFLGF